METQRNPNEPAKPKTAEQQGGQEGGGGQQGGGSQQEDRDKQERERQQREREKQAGGGQEGGGGQQRGGGQQGVVSKAADDKPCPVNERREATPAVLLVPVRPECRRRWRQDEGRTARFCM